ncbi:MAG: hypothetical protein E7242_01160 [Lachnospiraceae bacterium]|nr:hypothetical protein [Lachnospiraceae bacterium]
MNNETRLKIKKAIENYYNVVNYDQSFFSGVCKINTVDIKNIEEKNDSYVVDVKHTVGQITYDARGIDIGGPNDYKETMDSYIKLDKQSLDIIEDYEKYAIEMAKWRQEKFKYDLEYSLNEKITQSPFDDFTGWLIVSPGTYPRVCKDDINFDKIEEILEGNIEVRRFLKNDPGVVFLMNADREEKDFLKNRAIIDDDNNVKEVIKGTFIIASAGEDGIIHPLSKEKCEEYKTMFYFPERFFKDEKHNIIVDPYKPASNKKRL